MRVALGKKNSLIYNPPFRTRNNMMLKAHPIRRIFARFFPSKYAASQDSKWEFLPEEQKKEYALSYLAKGELALLQGNLHAIAFFETASQLDPNNPNLWYRQGLSFFEYGSEEGKEKALLLASKHFKFATQLDPLFFEAWIAWGNALFQFGRFHSEHHFHLEAKEKYQKALELAAGQPREALAELYWDYGLAWAEIAQYSGEAFDVRCALEAFQKSLSLQEKPSPEFFNDCGKAYLEMGLLINDSRLYFQAIDSLKRAVAISPSYFEGWASLGETFSQLYLATMDERYVSKASDAFAQAVRLSPRDAETWLGWAQILAESGRLNDHLKLLRQSIEKCARAATLDNKDPLITAQWVESLSLLGASAGQLDLLIEAEHKILQATDAYPDDPDLWHAYGICLASFGRYYADPEYFELAIEKLQRSLSMDRTCAEYWHTLGLVHKWYGDLLQADDLLERTNRFLARAMDLKPSYPALLFDAACGLLHFSEAVDDLPALEKAISYFESLLQNYKEAILYHPEWLYEYARAIEWLGDFSGDEAHFSRAIEIFSHILLIDPDFSRIHCHIAHCYIEIGHITCEAEFYKRAIPFFRLAIRQEEENDSLWLDWGICLIHLAHHTLDVDFMNQLYADAEQKISRSGTLGHPAAYYHLACLYSILGRTDEAMTFIHKSLAARALPPIEEMLEDQWLDNLRATDAYTQFLNALETKLQAREQ